MSECEEESFLPSGAQLPTNLSSPDEVSRNTTVNRTARKSVNDEEEELSEEEEPAAKAILANRSGVPSTYSRL